MQINTQELRIEMVRHDIKSISQLSALSGIDRNTISGILHNKIRPSTQTMEKLISVFGWTGARAGEIFFADKLA